MSNRIWTISNALSVLRVLLVVPIVLLFGSSDSNARGYAVGCIILAALTDLLDGWLARKLNQVSEVGKVIDPLADKIAVGAIVTTLMLRTDIPVWYFILVVTRDIVIFAGGIYVQRSRKVMLQSNVTGKWAVSAVAVYILLVALGGEELSLAREFFLVISAGMLLFSFALYLRRFLVIINPPAIASPPRHSSGM
jgi:CDP-diacylglycerol--glycerol-3-phosphate 3-phosphatidyltransferase